MNVAVSSDYELVDFGGGRRLERFDAYLLDRPCPTAESLARKSPPQWEAADAVFHRGDAAQGRWVQRRSVPGRWPWTWGQLRLELKLTEFGHLGVFPEQAENWSWIDGQVRRWPGLRLLNLFAYTGASTLAAAAAGATVTHVDAAKNVVAWARRNAELSGLAAAPIRWICEDARKFVRRERKRGSVYDAVILDPPTYGHGAHGEVWRLSTHLAPLLADCIGLMEGRPRFVLLTCHTPDFPAERLASVLRDALGGFSPETIEARSLTLTTADGRRLPSGEMVRLQI